MKQKIEWYKEILELEPGSRVFFPLAKLLVADRQTNEAIAVLRQGVSRHPDHIEASLFLVELLTTAGNMEGIASEVKKLESLLMSYPGFLAAWSAQLAQSPATADAALAVKVLSSALQGNPMGWAAIIERGIQSLFADPSGGARAESNAVPVVEEPDSLHSAEPSTKYRPEDLSAALLAPGPDPIVLPDFSDEEETDEPFSLRTRSMADVLAEQGDVKGALEIYQELEVSSPDKERAGLRERIEELTSKLASGIFPEAHEDADEGSASGGESTRLVDLLESLAQRLEARAR